jgi:hypothetical protein
MKSGKLVEMEEIVSGIGWLFVTMTAEAALFRPMAWLPKETLEGVALTARIPSPLRAKFCGLVVAESAIESVAVLVPKA